MKRFIPSLIWTIAIFILYFMDAASTTSLCIFKLIGFKGCWGCGIGHSIHYTLHVQFSKAVEAHIMGIPATVGLLWLIIKPLIHKNTPYESTTINDARS